MNWFGILTLVRLSVVLCERSGISVGLSEPWSNTTVCVPTSFSLQIKHCPMGHLCSACLCLIAKLLNYDLGLLQASNCS